MDKSKKLIVDKEKISYAIKMNAPISITTYTLPKVTETYIGEVTAAFFTMLHHEDMIDCISYCLKELTTNAKKANTKRVFFMDKGLDISNQEDYDKGMESFKEETLSNQAHYLQLQKDAKFFIKVTMRADDDFISIEVQNNCQMTQLEFKRVFDKIVRAKQFTNLNDAIEEVLDNSEGAGLGLIIMVLMLKKMGLDSKAFEFTSENGITRNRITIPRNVEFKKQVAELAETMAEYIDKIPQFPEKISQIQQAIKDPDAKMSHIAALISGDIGLALDLLKHVNSVAFGLPKKCMNIAEAVKLMGLRGIQNMIYSLISVQILESTNEEQKRLWNEAYKLAFFSLNIAKSMGDKKVIEDSYVCGLLHDLGKIVFCSVYPEMLVKISELQAEKNIPVQVMDTIMSGMEYSAIGAALAKKWNMPAPIIDTIKYRNHFKDAPQENKALVEVVCFADFMRCFSENKIEYYQIPEELLKIFKIQNEAELRVLCKKFEEGFERAGESIE